MSTVVRELPQLLTLDGAAAELGVSVSTIRRLVDEGELDQRFVKSLPRITGTSIAAYIDELPDTLAKG